MKRVLLAMSGGIDSAVSAVLLQEQGFEVMGATMRLCNSDGDPYGVSSGCFGPQEPQNRQILERVGKKLGIQILTIDLSKQFENEVLEYYRSNYLEGRTPNPCVVCNSRLKFGLLPKMLRDQGMEFDLFATGHYARIRICEQSGRWQLLKGIDPLKDQSYFLCLLTQAQLATTLFPLGKLTKARVREIASLHGLDFLLSKAESQDFLSEEDHPRLFKSAKIEPGEMVDPLGKVVGNHRGLIHYTIGQRRHLGLSGMSEPWYVIGLDNKRNRVKVGPQSFLHKDRLTATKVNWVSIQPTSAATRAEIKIRLGHNPVPGTLRILPNGSVEAVFDTPQMSITSGQYAVFYDGDILLGGGTIA